MVAATMQTRSLPRRVLVSFALACAAFSPAIASAQADVIVLGVRSIEGDDEFARNLTGALRHAANQVDGWDVSDREVTLEQMSLAHGCDELEPVCLGQIAEALSADRLIYGEVRRTSAAEHYDYSVNLHVFNNETHQIERSVTDTIPGVHDDIDDLRDVVRRYASELSGAPRVGTLFVSVNVPGAEVFIDDQPVGTSDAQGRLTVTDVQAGNRNVRVAAEGRRSFRSTVAIEAYGEATFEAELEQGRDEGPPAPFPAEIVAGSALLAGGLALAGVWIYSMVYIDSLANDVDYVQYRRDETAFWQTVLGGGDNPHLFESLCDYARGTNEQRYLYDGVRFGTDMSRADRARDICDEADTWEVLQFVFMGGAAVLAGVGLYLLITGATQSSGEAEAQSWFLTPSAGPDHGYLGVVGIF
jgi:hypothetical protein